MTAEVRVSDEELEDEIEHADDNDLAPSWIALDLRDARQEIKRLRQELRDARAELTEARARAARLEKALRELRDYKPYPSMLETIEKMRDVAARALQKGSDASNRG